MGDRVGSASCRASELSFETGGSLHLRREAPLRETSKGEVERLSEGTVTMGPGTLYGTIKRLRAQGLVEETDERPDPDDDDERRRYYRLTGLGERVLEAEVARLRRMITNAGGLRARPGLGGGRLRVLLTLTAMLAAASVIAIFTFGTPAIPFAVLLVGAAIAQRSRLARAVDGGPPSTSRTALAVLWLSALLFGGSIVGWVLAIDRGDSIGGGALLVYNAVGVGSLVGIVAASVVLIRRRRSRRVRA